MAKKQANDSIDVQHLAQLAQLSLSPKEQADLKKQLTETIKYINVLQELELNSIPPTSQVTGQKNIARLDQARPYLTQKEALVNAAQQKKGYFVSRRIRWGTIIKN